MKVYLADNIVGNAVYCMEYEAQNDREAERPAKKHGWVYLGEKVGEIACDPVLEAMIESHGQTFH